MRLTLLLPDLLWPAQALRDATDDLPLPSLATLLGRGCVTVGTPATVEAWLADALGMDIASWPGAALRLLGAGQTPGAGYWLCADPARIALTASGMPLDDPADLALTAEECRQLRQALAPLFEDIDGGLVATAPGHWHLCLPGPLRLGTTPLSEATGRDVKGLLPGGADARPWRARLNEAQILLHGHPVNRAREAAGRPTANTLWFWGEGALPAPLRPRWRRLFWDDPLAGGLARLGGMEDPGATAPRRLADLPAGDGATLVVLDHLAAPTRARDALAWRAALERLETDWFRPLRDELRGGAVSGLELVAPGEAGNLRLALDRGDLWRFWRRPVALAALAERLP